jgi:alpha-tubulin suppressor-like RCC1 family protein
VGVTGLTGVTAIATGEDHTCALRSTRIVECWGNNNDGQLGDGSTTHSTVPVAVRLIRVTVITAGRYQTCAVQSTGTAKCWGNNVAGQLGDGSTTNSPVPVAVNVL